ncbi:anthocyanidin 3-O-glucosyltransferase 7 [Quercus suber]|uniref:anthocyanidin 3-O-glucosyltransferase 7 n=1 Tax=Quercus suber TaxID=58331 RepID=UPI000CE19075|nr:anthocyanidin 3-O-glucosyltransferase 7-like [Quercus suber]POE50367.1 anthocyanidin 3-o-glucosyltransferase 2 [Quercus suber]
MSVTMETSPHKHVAVLAFPFGSHPLSLLTLARKLANVAPSVHFSFLNTQKSNHSLFSTAKPDMMISPNIKAYDVADGVPEGHVLSQNPIEAVELFIKASPENFKRGLEVAVSETGKKISCLISDGFLTFAVELADDLHVPWIPVWAPLPGSLSAHLYKDHIREHFVNKSGAELEVKGATLEFIPGLSQMRVSDLPKEVLSENIEGSLFSRMLNQVGLVLPRATAVVLNSYEELNPPLLNRDLKLKFRMVLNVGFYTASLPSQSGLDLTGCMAWLDEQKERSVAYISFGTVATPPHNELIALAEALEVSGIPFLWSLKDNIKDLLPKEFVERIGMQGKIVAWTPQTQVLAHASIAVFVTQCGSNSVAESIANGVPLICRPFFADHHMTGRMVEEVWEIGVKVEDGILTKSGLLNSLELILGHEKGKVLRDKAQALKHTVQVAASPNGTAAKDFSQLVELLLMS